MTPWDFPISAPTLRRLLSVTFITASNIHKCFNGFEQLMVVPPGIRRMEMYDCYTDEEEADELEAAEKAYLEAHHPRSSANTTQSDSPPPHTGNTESEHTTSDKQPIEGIGEDNLVYVSQMIVDAGTEPQEEPIHSQFGPIGSPDHRHVSRHMGGPLPEHILDEPAYFYVLTTYMSYMILIWIGRARDFFGKIFSPRKYMHFKERDGYAPLTSDFENFYYRRLKARMNDCFARPITGVPGRYITLLDRVSNDYFFETFKYTGTQTETLNLSSYNYLGFAQSSGPCADDVQQSLSYYGVSSTSPRLDSGTSDLTQEVERQIADFIGKEDAMVFSMGFSTNATSFPDLVGPGCLIISDELNHSSIRYGARSSGAVIKSYQHNDMVHLEKLLRDAISQGQPRTHKAWRKILVACEGLFSMEGTIADLPAIILLKKKYKFYLFIDEAHSIGALGPRGRGICDYFDIDTTEVDILMGTLTKSFGANGGYIAADKAIIQKLRSSNAAMLYGESPTPPVLMQILSSLRQITSTEVGLERLQRITFNSRYLRLGLKRLGFIVYGHDDSPIVPMMLYHPGKLSALSREMLKRNISVVIAGYPATPLLTARVRFCVSAAHNKEDMDRVLRACDEISELLDLKISTGIMGGIEALPEGMTLADVQNVDDRRSRKVVLPRWTLQDVMAHGVEDCKRQLR